MKNLMKKQKMRQFAVIALGFGIGMILATSAQAGLQEQMKGIKSLLMDLFAPIIIIASAVMAGSARLNQGGGLGSVLGIFAAVLLLGFGISLVASGEYLKIGTMLAGGGEDG